MRYIHGANRRTAKAQKLVVCASLSVFLAGCGSPNYAQSELHLSLEKTEANKPASPQSIPSLVRTSVTAPALTGAATPDTFDVVVTNVPVRDLLFALSRDAQINMDIDARVGGVVSINAIDQTLDAILERLKEQVDFRVTRVGDAMVIKPDEPYHKRYDISYLSLTRTYSSSASTGSIGEAGTSSVSNTADNDFWTGIEEAIGDILGTAGGGGGETGAVAALEGQDNAGLVGAVDESERRTTSEDSSYNLNRNAGVLLVFATDRLQKEVQAYLDKVLTVAKRQVLLEATIVEVQLSNDYAQGIDWSVFNSLAREGLAVYQGGLAGGPAALFNELTRTVTQTFGDNVPITINGRTPTDLTAAITEARRRFDAERRRIIADGGTVTESNAGTVTPVITGGTITGYQWSGATIDAEEFNETATAARGGGLQPTRQLGDNFFTGVYRSGDISAAVQLLDRFGDAKVLSSPRLSAMNNQPALLRVGTQEVYFNIESTEEVNEDTGRVTERTFTVEEETVDVGFSMNVLPYVGENGEIMLNLRPAVNRLVRYINAPVPPNLGGGINVINQIPILAQREMETIVTLRDGEVAVLGGLLEDTTSDNSTGVPGLNKLPGIGSLFENKNQTTRRTEFIVFIKARIVKNPSVHGDYADFLHLLPDSDFINRDHTTNYLPPAQQKTR